MMIAKNLKNEYKVNNLFLRRPRELKKMHVYLLKRNDESR